MTYSPLRVGRSRTLPLYPIARLATMAFGISVVCTPDLPNGLRALRGVHWDTSPGLCQHTRIPVGVSPALAQASGSDIWPFNRTARRPPAARALSCRACALARRHDGTEDPSNLWLFWWNVPRGKGTNGRDGRRSVALRAHIAALRRTVGRMPPTSCSQERRRGADAGESGQEGVEVALCHGQIVEGPPVVLPCSRLGAIQPRQERAAADDPC
jgi:hypothetical protein